MKTDEFRMYSSHLFILFTHIRTLFLQKVKSMTGSDRKEVLCTLCHCGPSSPALCFSSCPLSMKGHLYHPKNTKSGFVLANTQAIVCLVLDIRLEVAVCHIKALGTNASQTSTDPAPFGQAGPESTAALILLTFTWPGSQIHPLRLHLAFQGID